MDARTLVIVWLCLSASILAFALYATVRELRAPRDRTLEGRSPLNAPTGSGFLPRPGINPNDGPALRLGKVLGCVGWYAVAIALLGFAVAGFSSESVPVLLAGTMYAVYLAIGLLLLGWALRAIGKRARSGDL